jgi:hypothetical protein
MATSVTQAQSLVDVFQSLIVTADDESTPVLDLLGSYGRVIPSTGGNSVDWPLRYTENASTAALASEGSAYATAGNALMAGATVAHSVTPINTVFELTGTLEDFNKGEGAKYDAYEQEFQSALKMHNGKREDNAITALEAAIASAGSYAGLVRATYKLASYEAQSAATALALSDMNTLYNTLAADPIVAGLQNHIIVSNNTRRNEYNEVAVGTGAGDPRIATVQDQIIDAGKQRAKSQFNSLPWFEATRMTAGTILMFDPSLVKVTVVRPVNIKEVPVAADKRQYVITSNETTTVFDPRKCGKIIAKV